MEMRRRNADQGDLNGHGVTTTTSSSSRTRRRPRSKKGGGGGDSIVSCTTVLGLIVMFLVAGFLQHQYQKSRGSLHIPGVPLPKYIRDMQQRQQQQNGESHVSSSVSTHSLLSEEEDLSLERDQDGIRYHLIFSTDCSPYQHWQSYLVYFSAMMVRQPGHVTRIASGCENDEAKAMQDWFQQSISHMSPTRFHLQLTPHFSSVVNDAGEFTGDYKFFNKPFGLKYWMENAPQLKFNLQDGTFPQEVQSDIVILIDPDMGLLRPLTRDFTSDDNTVFTRNRREHILARTVGPGKPFAQAYGFGVQWAKLNLTKITGTADSPAAKIERQEGLLHYPVGPPYLATVTDMFSIAQKWTEFVPRVHEQYPYLLAEMFAFCIAAAHLELPHQLVSSLMVSDTEISGDSEGWPLIDSIPDDQVCDQARGLVQYPPQTTKVPNVVHMCQRYGLGSEWFFSKRAIPTDSLYGCETPLYAEPPSDLTLVDYKIMPPKFERKTLHKGEPKRMAFMICYLYRLVNEAAAFYKANACGSTDKEPPNLQKTRSLVEYMKEKSYKKHQK